jgi:hypothetical protein
MADQMKPDDSQFRLWFRDCLKGLPGNIVEWPILMKQILSQELHRLRTSEQYYKCALFRNRDEKVSTHRGRDSQDEEILVYRLYGVVHDNYQGVLTIGGTPIWLFSCEVPNQGMALSNKTKKRRADLLGLRQDGSLVVFECKGPHNHKDSPLYGLLEGLDYLGCMLTQRNLARLNDDLQEWIVEYEPKEPDSPDFRSVIPNWTSFAITPEARHSVVVLAPQNYFDFHMSDATGRSKDWWLLSNRFTSQLCPDSTVDLDFAVVDFDQGSATWLNLPVPLGLTASTNIQSSGAASCEILTRDLIWHDGQTQHKAMRVRRGEKNTRIRLADGSTRVVPNHQLRSASSGTT